MRMLLRVEGSKSVGNRGRQGDRDGLRDEVEVVSHRSTEKERAGR